MGIGSGTTEFGAVLRRSRLAAGFSLEALAERAGLSASAIGALERGARRAPYPDTLRRLVDALRLGPAEAAALAVAVDRHHAPARPATAVAAGPTAVDEAAAARLAPLIGRERELAAVSGLLRGGEGRLVTLAGPAGVGKTRLALAVADALADAFPEPVAVVDLAPVREPGQVVAAVAARLGVQDHGGPPPLRLLRALAGRRLLVVLDNFEQVLPAARELPELLAGASGLTLLVTSRAPLRLRAEHVYLVPPLSLPDPEHLPPPAELAQVPAVALFVDRAAARGADVILAEHTARPVAELVVRLDGLPLAIELAAARTPVLSPRMILERLGGRQSLLRWEASDLPERQQTLAGAIAWSYDLLGEGERALFRRLGAFAGGFSLEAAEALMASTGRGDVDVLEGLVALVAASLVVSEADGAGGRRYRLLQSMRDYALERLAEHGEREATAQAHAVFFVALAERAEPPALATPGQRAWLLRLEHERENVHAALQWLVGAGDRELELRLAAAAVGFWLLLGNSGEGWHWLEAALRRAPNAPPPLRLKALIALGRLHSSFGEGERARAILLKTLARARELDATSHVAECLINLGFCDIRAGAWDAAIDHGEQGLQAARAAGNGALAAQAQVCVGAAVYMQGQPQRATRWLEAAVRECRALGDAVTASSALTLLGAASGEVGDHPRAVACFRESLELNAALDDPWALIRTGQRLALLCDGAADDELLADLVGALEALQRTHGLGSTMDQSRRERLSADLRARLGPERFAAAAARGRARSFDQTVALARQILDGLPDAAAGACRAAGPAAGGAAVALSPREREVLALVADGLSNREIADRLSVAERTAKHHLTGLFNKLGVSSRTQALAVARRRGHL